MLSTDNIESNCLYNFIEIYKNSILCSFLNGILTDTQRQTTNLLTVDKVLFIEMKKNNSIFEWCAFRSGLCSKRGQQSELRLLGFSTKLNNPSKIKWKAKSLKTFSNSHFPGQGRLIQYNCFDKIWRSFKT